MKKWIVLTSLTTMMFANIEVQSIDVFANTTRINQTLDKSKKSVDLLSNVSFEKIYFDVPKGCELHSSSVIKKDYSKDKLALDIVALQKDIAFLENQKRALESNIAYLEKTALTQVSNPSVLIETSKFLKKEILSNSNEVYLLKNKIKQQKKALKKLFTKRSQTLYTQLKYEMTCSNTKSITINYPLYSVQKNSFYGMNYDSESETIHLKQNAFITQSTGTDFKNIDINLHTYNWIKTLKPRPFYPQYLDVVAPIAYGYNQESHLQADGIVMMKSMPKATKKRASIYKENAIRASFSIKNAQLLSGKKTSFVFWKEKYKTKSVVEIDGYSLSQPFFKVTYESNKVYAPQNAKLYMDNVYMGQMYLKGMKKNKEESLYFGTHGFIDVKKELLKDMKEEPFFSMNKLKTQKIWKYTITNNHAKKQKILLVEKLPVSKHEKIEVTLLGKSTHSKLEKNGKITYLFDMEPKSSKTITFGYEVTKPAKRIK